MLKLTVLCFLCAAALAAQDADGKLRVIAFGAHPDDCDIRAAGTAAKFAAMGHHVKFVSVTNGDAGHQSQGGGMLAMRRRAEAMESGRRLGVTYGQGYLLGRPAALGEVVPPEAREETGATR